MKFVKANKNQIWVRTIGNPIVMDGAVVWIIGNIMEITERKMLELSLWETFQKLKVLTGLTRHDVVNDLSAILLNLEMISEESDESIKQKSLLNAIESARILEKTIAFTMEYEQFGSISCTWDNLHNIISSAQSAIVLTGITVTIFVRPDIEIFTDPIIRKVFTTLFENSVRHGGDSITDIWVFSREQDMEKIPELDYFWHEKFFPLRDFLSPNAGWKGQEHDLKL